MCFTSFFLIFIEKRVQKKRNTALKNFKTVLRLYFYLFATIPIFPLRNHKGVPFSLAINYYLACNLFEYKLFSFIFSLIYEVV